MKVIILMFLVFIRTDNVVIMRIMVILAVIMSTESE